MPRLSKALPALLLAATVAALGCHAQNPPAGSPVTPELSRRIEVLLRQKASLPPASVVNVGPRKPGPFPGFDSVSVSFTNSEGKASHPIDFLLSADGKTLAQFSKYDISADPRNLVSAEGRPSRGGPAGAPVLIVGFDDLECPYCARLHAEIFPALTERYKEQVHIVYKDFPLDTIHPWAMRAAIDASCLAAESPAGYWNYIDYVHAHAGEIGNAPDPKDPKAAPQKTLLAANDQLDKLTREQGAFQKADSTRLEACVQKQDTSTVDASKKLALSMGLDSAPTLFINGDKIDGAVPLEFLYKIIDDALIAEGKTPPPPYVAPKPPTPLPPATPPPASPPPANPSPAK